MFEEYGTQKTLVEIMEELLLYCNIAGVTDAEVSIILPKRIVDHLKQEVGAKERQHPSKIPIKVGSIRVSGGKVSIYNDEENEVVVK